MLSIQMKQNMNILLKMLKKNDLENLQNTKAVIIYSNNMQDVYKNIEEYNPDRECKVLIAWWYDYLCD